MNKDITININDTVKVELNELGRKIIREKYGCLKTANGYYETQLHNLISDFSDHIRSGQPLPFNGDILFEVDI